MIERIISLGRNKTVILIIGFTVVLSLIITGICMHLLDVSHLIVYKIYIIATIAPMIITPIVAIVLVNALLKAHELEKEMRELASIDYLSKLLSRRAWIEQTEKYIYLAMRNNSSFSILMIDLDDFKDINDQYGHSTGDKVLIEFGKTVRELCRASDIPARFGGEEFVILLPDTTLNQALHFTERLHKAISQIALTYENKNLTFTISIGICIHNATEPCDIDVLISQSDKALYQAKQQGKNRTSIFSSDFK
jgi:diguanylate cyclase (GGDEF)-like protein